jgi:hypothetical protein
MNQINLLNELSNWKLEAKLEDTDKYFYDVKELESLISGDKSYLIGRKGTGKTAIAQKIFKINSYNVFTESLSFKNFPFNDLYSLKNTRFTQPNEYITLWKYVIYSTVAKKLSENQSINGPDIEKLRGIFLNDADLSLSRRLKIWTSAQFGSTIFGSGANASASSQVATNDTPWVDRVDMLEDIIRKNIDESDYYIVFDELDEDYKQMLDPEANTRFSSLLTGLFKAVQDIRATFPIHRYKIKPIIFIRDDIYDLQVDSDKNKWRDLSIMLDWRKQDIKNLLTFRISRAANINNNSLRFSEAWHSVFSNYPVEYGNRQQKEMEIFEYMSRSTQMRPRDFISYISICAKKGKGLGGRISPSLVRETDKEFSNYLRNELEDEIGGVISEIRSIFDVISHLRKQTFSIDEFRSSFGDAVKRKSIPDIDVNFVLKILFYFSVLGNQPRQLNSSVFRYENKEAKLNYKESLVVHRGLYKSLQII